MRAGARTARDARLGLRKPPRCRTLGRTMSQRTTSYVQRTTSYVTTTSYVMTYDIVYCTSYAISQVWRACRIRYRMQCCIDSIGGPGPGSGGAGGGRMVRASFADPCSLADSLLHPASAPAATKIATPGPPIPPRPASPFPPLSGLPRHFFRFARPQPGAAC